MLERLFNLAWYGKFQWTWVLWPLSLLYGYVVKQKRQAYLESISRHQNNEGTLPVIVVGNITVGGTGKTPVVQSLVRHLGAKGYKPGIISRGYGGSLTSFPHLIKLDDASSLVGDEPYMLFHSLSVPVVIDPVRKSALVRLVQEDVDVVISDDGLQHYALDRDIEVCVIDGSRGLGNGQLIPVGPMREPQARLESVDYVLKSADRVTDGQFQIKPKQWVNLKTGNKVPLNEFESSHDALAIAGIGNPDKFFNSLKSLGIECQFKAFEDHYAYSSQDFIGQDRQILMTEKDAVKITSFAYDDMWYLEIQAALPDAFLDGITSKLDSR